MPNVQSVLPAVDWTLHKGQPLNGENLIVRLPDQRFLSIVTNQLRGLPHPGTGHVNRRGILTLQPPERRLRPERRASVGREDLKRRLVPEPSASLTSSSAAVVLSTRRRRIAPSRHVLLRNEDVVARTRIDAHEIPPHQVNERPVRARFAEHRRPPL